MDPVTVLTIKALVLPPGLNLLIGTTGLVLWQLRKRLGATLMVLSMLSLYLFSVPYVAERLVRSLGLPPALGAAELERPRAQAIVVLGSGRYPGAPEYGGDTVSAAGLVRLRYAALLHKSTGLPLFLSGGAVYGEQSPEAILMAQYLQDSLGVSARWTEISSRNTAENASNSAAILSGEGVGTVYLVTHAWHMPRAAAAFEKAGLEVIPAPTGFPSTTAGKPGWAQWLPGVDALQTTTVALHELIGMQWYKWAI